MELEESSCLTSDYTKKLWSLRQYGTGTKTEIQISGIKQKVQIKSMQLWTLFTKVSLTKEARIYNGKKTTSLTSGAGKTGQPLVKE